MSLRFVVGALAILTAALPTTALARPHHHHRHHVASRSYGNGEYYTAVSGHQGHRPMQASNRPAGATARCRDETWSFSENNRGTCSHHGGVASWL